MGQAGPALAQIHWPWPGASIGPVQKVRARADPGPRLKKIHMNKIVTDIYATPGIPHHQK